VFAKTNKYKKKQTDRIGMKKRHIYFFVLKIIILVQFMLIMLKKQTFDSRVYLLTEIVFKTSLFLFIEILLFHQEIPGLGFEDKLIISFAGGLLFFDAWFNDFPKLKERLQKPTTV
jgi:hypothetical protein